MKRICEEFSSRITGYLDGELGNRDREATKQHLEECDDCQQRYLNEKKLKLILGERVRQSKAPAVLQSRIRRQLYREESTPGFWKLINALFEYRPVATSFGIAVIAILILWPSLQLLIDTGSPSASLESPVNMHVQLEGEIVCLDCEFLHGHVKGLKHDQIRHRPGLKTSNNGIWTFLQDGSHQELFNNPDFLRRKVRVSGTLFANSRYLEVLEYRLL